MTVNFPVIADKILARSVAFTPREVLLKTSNPSSRSASCTELVRDGWEMNNFSDALLNEPASATPRIYFICCNVIILGFKQICTQIAKSCIR